jgi:hypothetical protein
MVMAEKASVLVVANQTVESDELVAALSRRSGEGPAQFTLLVPAKAHGLSWAADMDSGGEDAQKQREALTERLRATGLDVTGVEVGDADPLAAVQDAANFGSYDEVIISTLPRRLSRWLHLDLPHKAGHATGLPVTHVEGSD